MTLYTLDNTDTETWPEYQRVKHTHPEYSNDKNMLIMWYLCEYAGLNTCTCSELKTVYANVPFEVMKRCDIYTGFTLTNTNGTDMKYKLWLGSNFHTSLEGIARSGIEIQFNNSDNNTIRLCMDDTAKTQASLEGLSALNMYSDYIFLICNTNATVSFRCIYLKYDVRRVMSAHGDMICKLLNNSIAIQNGYVTGCDKL